MTPSYDFVGGLRSSGRVGIFDKKNVRFVYGN